MMIKISFVLPCYNVDRYIADCLDSIYSQDMPEEEYEVICVDDGSSDGTRAIIQQYASAHANLVPVFPPVHLNTGGVRDKGVEMAKGEYIWMADPDDVISPNMVGTLYQKASESKSDILFFNFQTVDEQLSFIKNCFVFSEIEPCSGQEYVARFYPGQMSQLCIVWWALFRTAFLRDNNIYVPHMRKASDVAFLWPALVKSKRVVCTNEIGYVYRNNPYSVVRKKHDAEVLFSERILFGNEIALLLKKGDTPLLPVIEKDMRQTLSWCANDNLVELKEMTAKERSAYYDEIQRHKAAVKRVRPYMNRKQRLLFFAPFGRRLWLCKVGFFCKYL